VAEKFAKRKNTEEGPSKNHWGLIRDCENFHVLWSGRKKSPADREADRARDGFEPSDKGRRLVPLTYRTQARLDRENVYISII